MDIFSKNPDPSGAASQQPQQAQDVPQPGLDSLREAFAQPSQPQQQPSPEPAPAPAQNQDQFQSQQYFPDYLKPLPEDEIYTWTGPSRPFKKHNRQYYTTVATIVLLISLILFFAGQFLPIAVVIAVGFLAYVLSSIPPHDITVKLTTYGIRVEEQLYYWEEVGRFWFSEKYGQQLVNFETARFPGRLTLVVTPEQKQQVQEIVSEVLLEEKPPATQFERMSTWLQEKIPLDIDR